MTLHNELSLLIADLNNDQMTCNIRDIFPLVAEITAEYGADCSLYQGDRIEHIVITHANREEVTCISFVDDLRVPAGSRWKISRD